MKKKRSDRLFCWMVVKKMLRIMRLCLVLLCVFTLSATARTFAQNERVSLNLVNVSVKELFDEIQRQTQFCFLFNPEQTASMGKLSVKVEQQPVETVLQQVFKDSDLTYRFKDDLIVVIRKIQALPAVKALKITGIVSDENGLPIPGVTVMIKGTSLGTVTDKAGQYSLTLPQADHIRLIFSFVGMQTQEISYKGKKQIHVTMKPELAELDEVVVIGYGSKDKKSLTSSVSSMKNEQVERFAGTIASVDDLLGGNVKGVFSSQESGAPGAAIKIQIRGITSLPGFSKKRTNSPLYVIDGMPMFIDYNDISPLLGLSPNDIESIDILKDAAATAIYGSRGANGVIIVKTKGGRKGEKINVEAGYTFSVGNPIKEYSPLNTNEFKTLQDTKFKTALYYYQRLPQDDAVIDMDTYEYMFTRMGHFEVDEDPETGGYWLKKYLGLNNDAFGNVNTNWVQAIKNKNAVTHQYNVAVRGGTEFSNYSLSLNAIDQEGLLINDRLKRYGARFSIDSEIMYGIQAGGVLGFSYAGRNGAGTEPYGNAWRVRPDIPVYDKNGDFMRYDASAAYGYPVMDSNPVAQRQAKEKSDSYQFMGNVYVSAELAKGLSVRADISVSSNMFDNSEFFPSVVLREEEYSDVDEQASFNKKVNRSTYTSTNFRVDYFTRLGNHNLSAMLGAGFDRIFEELVFDMFATGFSNQDVLHNLASARRFKNPVDGKINSGLNSIYLRFSYDYASRYLAELSFRSDVSSKFGPENRRAYFPALSLGWRIKNEAFLEDADKVDDLKVRLSIGKTGSTNVEDFSYLQYFGKKANYGGELAFGLENRLPNRHIHWEMTSEVNGGIDFSFFDNRLRGSLDMYNRFTKGALMDAPFVLESGMQTFTANLLDLSNRGFEFEIGGDVIRTKDFTWNSTFNIATNRNRVEKLNNANIDQYTADFIVEGQPMGVVKGFRVVKILQEEDLPDLEKINNTAIKNGGINKNTGKPNLEAYQSKTTGAGDYLYADINGDGMLTDMDDKVVIANPEPKFFGGWSNTFSYKGISLSCLMQFTWGGQSLYADMMHGEFHGYNSGQSSLRETFGRTWTPDNRNAIYPKVVMGRSDWFNSRSNDRFVFNTSYLRLKNITLSYDFPDNILNNIRLQKLMLFVSASNLFTLTRWPGIDPELVDMGTVDGAALEESSYPFSKTLSIGVKITF